MATIESLAEKHAVPVDYLASNNRRENIAGVINFFKGSYISSQISPDDEQTIQEMKQLASWAVDVFPLAIANWREDHLHRIKASRKFDIRKDPVMPYEEPFYRSDQQFYEDVREVLRGAGVDFPWET